MKKNDMVILEITSASGDGHGVARHEGEVIFVSNAIPGETVSAKILKAGKSAAWAKTDEVLTASPERIVPECPYYPKCGGCSYLHMSYDEELRLKLERVNDAFKRIGGLDLRAERIERCQSRFGYRNKAIFNAGPQGLGFYRSNSHDIIPVERCLLQSDFANRAAETVNFWVEQNGIPVYDERSGKGLLRKLFTRETQICVVANGKPRFVSELIELVRERLPECTSLVWNEQRGDTNVVFGDKFHTLSGRDTISISGIELPPEVFYQVNTRQANTLYSLALEFADLKSNETVLDLYCGVGALTALVAERVRSVTGVEISSSAVAAAKSKTIANADFMCADVSAAELPASDCVFIDPPRKGISQDVIEKLAQLSPSRIVYISCDPATLARDLKLFGGHGYKTERAVAVDMFPATSHVECVVLLERKDG